MGNVLHPLFIEIQFLFCVKMNRVSKFSARWIGNRGFSIGITDVTPSKSLRSLKKQLIETGYAVCEDNIKKFQEGSLAVLIILVDSFAFTYFQAFFRF